MIEKILKRLGEKDPSDCKCPVINTICPYRSKNFECAYTRLQRAVMMFDCAFK